MLETRVPYTFPKSFQFIFNAFGKQFDPAIDQIPDRAGDFEPVCDRLDAVTEPNALHGT